MKFKTRIFTTLLAVLMTFGSFALVVGAAEASTEKVDLATQLATYYLKTNKFKTPQEKLDSMELMLKNGKYELYVDSASGEVALHEMDTDNTLFSNPYDVASSKGSDMFSGSGSAGTKEQLLMSQVIVNYLDNGTSKSLYSFADAAQRGQIEVSRIKSGVRMEYTIGREEFRKLVPRWIPVDVFDELIKKPFLEAISKGAEGGVKPGESPDQNFYYKKFISYYQIKDPDAPDNTSASIDAMYKTYPITKEMPIYVFATDATAVEINLVEEYIKNYCADTYSFEQMDIDHETTGYEATDEEYPVFKLALEYTLDDTGLSVRVPCNGLQYNASSYTLENLSILPYMGAGNTKNDGYNFYPDGSGSLFDFNLNKTETIRGKIYGIDYAYHQISGKYQKAIRVPVYGTVAEEVIYSYGYTKLNPETGETESYPDVKVSNTVTTREEIEKILEGDNIIVTKPLTETNYSRGYVAVIESGESLGEIETYYAGALSDYATMSNYFNPKPKDSYDIADSISVTSSSMWTVVSNRKYTGNIRIHYQMLGNEKYDASWLGMAEAYRDYLVKKGTIQRLTNEDVEEDIPLYMEVFGTLETQQTIATMPVNVMTPLTTFENIITMYNELSGQGAKNINFKLTGFANGGMYSTVPSSLKWEKAVGGKAGFEQLVSDANNINNTEGAGHIGLYPDFDFAYSSENTLFDSLNLKKDAIKTIDNRYTSKRQYSATQQKYVSFFQLAISPSRYSKFYEKLMDTYSKYGLNTMSVASLGTALNSDFDEDEPYNREDSKDFTVKAFEDLSKEYSLMTDGGNAYSWGYVDHILNLDLDSSRYVKSSCSVPFLGVVLHGYVQFAGSPLNEEGDTDYALLKAIENGAGMYFILSYDNTQELKEDEILSQYYSIRYDIWKDDVVAYYNELNGLLKDVQTSLIIDHKFLNYNNIGDDGKAFLTERVLDADELDKEIQEELKRAEEAAKEQERTEQINKIAAIAEARIALKKYQATIDASLAQVKSLNASLEKEIVDSLAKIPASLKQDPATWVTAYRESMVKIWNSYEILEYQYSQNAEDVIAALEEQLAVIYAATQDEINSAPLYQFNEAKELLAEAKLYLSKLAEEQEELYEALVGKWSSAVQNNTVEGMDVDSWKTEVAAVFEGKTTFEAAFEAMNEWIVSIVEKTAVQADLDLAKIKEEGKYEPEVVEDDTDDSDEEVAYTRYHVTNNNVVSVTYGEIVGNNKVAQKTFLLNYNNYAVRVTYNGVVYTVAAGGYVIVPNNA